MSSFQPRSFLDGMEFYYEQSSGCFYLRDCEDVCALIGAGYSGKGSARNDPDREREIATGPIPRGVWRILPAIRHERLGPISIPLVRKFDGGWGRDGFYIHGDNAAGDGSASSGCIILPPNVRSWIDRSGIRTLVVG